MSTNKLKHYSKLLRLSMQAKLRLLCHVGESIKLANVMGVTISASVQLFISSFLTHFLILMRWHSSSRIRTVGCIIVCRIPRFAGCQHRYRGTYNERWAFQWAQPVHTVPFFPHLPPAPFYTRSLSGDVVTIICMSHCNLVLCLILCTSVSKISFQIPRHVPIL